MSNIFSFIEKNDNIHDGKIFFKQTIRDLPDEFLRDFLLDNWKKLKIHFQQPSLNNELDKMYDYFFLSKCERMKVYTHNIKAKENRKKFENIVQDSQKYLKKFTIHRINEFVVNNFDRLKGEMKKNY